VYFDCAGSHVIVIIIIIIVIITIIIIITITININIIINVNIIINIITHSFCYFPRLFGVSCRENFLSSSVLLRQDAEDVGM